MKKKIAGYKERIRNHFENVMKTKRGLHSIALGFSIGTFITILPTPGLNIILGLLVILIFPSISKYALFTSYFVFNGFVKIPLYLFAYFLGSTLLHADSEPFIETTLIQKTIIITQTSLLGIIILDVIISIASYYAVYSIVKRYRHRKMINHTSDHK